MNRTISRRSRFSGPSNQKKNARKASSFNPDHLIKTSPRETPQESTPSWKYEDLDINPAIKANLIMKGYQYPTPIQEQSINHLLEGKDLMGIAGTGTGKTAAFLIPILHKMTLQPHAQALVVLPTRELALQVEQEFISLSKELNLKGSCFIGGQSITKDIRNLKSTNNLIIGTPGRLIDLLNQGILRLDTISTLVLDEFDRMLEMGFIKDIQKIIHGMRNRKQTMFFSATLDKTQQHLIDQILTNPLEVKINSGSSPSDRVEQEIIRISNGENKFDVLTRLISNKDFSKVIVFAETKRQVDKLGKKLNQFGIKSGLIHGNKSQNQRNNSLNQFNLGGIRVLVATDVASRGLDLPDVTHVINYELPRTKDSYIHRIGRTGRAGKSGKAFTLVDANN